MKFGLMLSAQHQPGAPILRRLHEHLAQVRLARRLGFDSVAMGQHYLTTPYQHLQTVPLLGRLAAEAEGMAIGATVLLLPLHHPVELAEQVATLDVITGGRFICGVGVGYREIENEAFGSPFGERIARFAETLEVMRRLWTEEVVTFEGRFFRLPRVTLTLKPVQRPHPPIWVAANSDAGVRRAAQLGDAWVVNPHATLATLERQVALYRRCLDEAGKPFPADFPILKELYIAPESAAARREAQPHLASKYQSYVAWGQDKVLPREDGFEQPFDELVRDRFIIGDPALCREEIARHHERLGVTHFIFRLQWPGLPQAKVLRALRLLGTEVIPRFR
ncbi:MAG: LLM class flavin-dependent oxidoreductase [Deltaproteobacteria bacterium]|nr:LLM class flavin-dependent oxidoreductase [Deltaproteobacteria bacterium]